MARVGPQRHKKKKVYCTMSNYYSLHATSAVGSFLSSGKLVFIIRVMKTNLMH